MGDPARQSLNLQTIYWTISADPIATVRSHLRGRFAVNREAGVACGNRWRLRSQWRSHFRSASQSSETGVSRPLRSRFAVVFAVPHTPYGAIARAFGALARAFWVFHGLKPRRRMPEARPRGFGFRLLPSKEPLRCASASELCGGKEDQRHRRGAAGRIRTPRHKRPRAEFFPCRLARSRSTNIRQSGETGRRGAAPEMRAPSERSPACRG